MAQDVAIMERMQGGEVFFQNDEELRKFAQILGMPDLQAKSDEIESLNWHTLEGIDVKPVYSSEDLLELENLEKMPGIEPFL